MQYTVENEFLTLTVSEKGAELRDLRQKSEPQLPLLWDGQAAWPRRAPVCFPWCGKAEDRWFIARGQRYDNTPQHGFIRDLDHILTDQTPDRLSFRLDWPGQAPYPWPFTFETVHTLEGADLVTVCSAINTGDEPMPVQLGFHVGLRCPFSPDKALTDYVIRFEKPEAPDGGDLFPLDEHCFDNDSICFPHLASAWVQVEEKDTGKHLRIHTQGFPYVLLWSAPGVPGFVCIEPWTGYVGPGHDLAQRPGAILLPPGETFTRTHRLTVGI